MSKSITLSLSILSQRHISGISISRVLGDLVNSWPDEHPSNIAGTFRKQAQKELIDEQNLLGILRYCDSQDFNVGKLNVEVPASKERFDSHDHIIELDFIHCEYRPDRWFGFVPAVAVANIATSLGFLEINLIETVLLEYHRNKRQKDQKLLISTQWFNELEITQHNINLSVPTPSELSERGQSDEDRIVFKTTRAVAHSKNRTYGLDRYLEELQKNILGDFRQSVLVVGPNGSGKTALINQFFSSQKNVFDISPRQTTAAQMLRVLTENGGWQFALGQWLTSIRKSCCVVYVGNFAEYFEVGQYSGNNISIGEALRETLQRNEITLIGELTETQLERIDLRSPGYSNLFHLLRMGERKSEDENRIAVKAVEALSEQYEVEIESGAVARMVSLHRRYSPYSGYPGKTIHFFESLLTQHRSLAHAESLRLSTRETLEAFCNETGMPSFLIDDEHVFSATNAADFFNKRVIGQREAINELIRGITTVKARMARSGKPILTGLFVGPTGVGKTEIVKTLSEYIFDDNSRMIRLDMSEYSSPISVLRLTSANEASLVTKVRQQPFAVILFDEIEKADASFFDLLLQILDEGRLTDNQGETANFCSAIVVMTSNIGAREFSSNKIGFTDMSDEHEMHAHFDDAVARHFRPELINRIDVIVPFSQLSKDELLLVVRKEVELLKNHPGIVSREASMLFDDSVCGWLTDKITSTKYGGRAAQRVIQQELSWPLSDVLSAHAETERLSIRVSLAENRLKIDTTILTGEKRQILSQFEVADEAAQLRRLIQKLENSSTWVGMLSQLDRLDAIRLKKKDEFWKNRDWSREYEKYQKFSRNLESVFLNIYTVEEKALGSFRSYRRKLKAELLQDDIEICRLDFEELLVKLDSEFNNEHNNAVLSFYGPNHALLIVDKLLRDWLKDLELKYTMLYHYSLTSADSLSASNQSSADSTAKIETDNMEEIKDTAHAQEDAPRYSTEASLVNNSSHVMIGKAYVLHAPSVALYFANEPGVWQISRHSVVSLIYAELHMGDIKDLIVPDNVHRKQFYNGRKPDRIITNETYTDKRISAKDPSELRNHAQTMHKTRKAALYSIHLGVDAEHNGKLPK